MEYGDINLSTSEINQRLEAVPNKQDTLESGVNIKTINGQSILGSGDLSVGGSSDKTFTLKIKNYTTALAGKKFKLREVPKSSFPPEENETEDNMYETASTQSFVDVSSHLKQDTSYFFLAEYVKGYYVPRNGITIHTEKDKLQEFVYKYEVITWQPVYINTKYKLSSYDSTDAIGVALVGTNSSNQIVKTIIIPCGIDSIIKLNFNDIYNLPHGFPIIKNTEGVKYQENDFNGLSNTKLLAAANNDSSYNEMAYYKQKISAYQKEHNISFDYELYVPSAGELVTIFDNKTRINSMLSNVGSTGIFLTSNLYSTSTISHVDNAKDGLCRTAVRKGDNGEVEVWTSWGGEGYVYPLIYVGKILKQ